MATPRKHGKTSLYLLAFLVATTLITAISSFMSYRELARSAEESLRLQATGISVSLEAYVLQWTPGQGNIFRDIITEGTWEAIAFISLSDHEGTILLHSNDSLIGKKLDDRSLKDVLAGGAPLTHRMVLGTGEEVFVLDLPILSDRATRILRLALHMQPTETMVRQAQIHLATMAALTAILWAIGFFLMLAARRSESLETALREKEQLAVVGQMASVLAHEIRNPLGSIKGFAQYLLEQGQATDSHSAGKTGTMVQPTPPPEQMKEYLEIIVSESQRLESLTEDLLVYARPEEVRPETFDLLEFTQGLISQLRGQEECLRGKAELDTRIPAGLRITTDRDKLKQILTNVLQNSLDALGGQGRVEIGAQQSGGMIVITVKDNGLGMDAETIENAFMPFFTTKTRGTGLGLAIVEKLAGVLGGSVSLESTPGAGTSLEIKIRNARVTPP